MRQIMIIVLAAALLTSPTLCRAQDSEQTQNPKEYSQEDSNPLKFISYVLSPVGFLLEWTVARPLHYLATDSPLAPVFGGGTEEDLDYTGGGDVPAPIAEMPPSDLAPSRSFTESEGTAPRQGASEQSAPSRTWQPSAATPPSASSPPVQQPVLH